jgi:hypothetical protein
LVWDYRESTSAELCHSITSKSDACTGCTFTPTPTPPTPPTPVTSYRWLIESGSGSTTSPSTCPFATVPLYSSSSSFNTTFANSTFFYTDAALTTIFQGGDNYFGVRQPSQGYGISQGIFRMTNLGTASNIDTSGVCSSTPTPPTPTPTPPTPTPPTPTPITNSLIMWRNSNPGQNPPEGWTTAPLACSSTANPQTVYFTQSVNSWADVVNNSLVVYENPLATAPYQGRDTYFRTVQLANSGNTFLLSNVGVVSSYATCSAAPTPPTPTPTPSPSATVWYQNGYILGGVHQGHATTSAACADSFASGRSAFYLSDSLGPVNTAQDIRNSQAAGRTVNIWANSGLSVPMNGNSTFFGVNKDNNQNQAGMVIKFGSGVLETVVGSDLLASCLNTINLAGGTYSSYLDACNNGPSDAKTTYYQIASGCATGTAWTDIDMAQVLQNSSVSGFGIYYQEASECPGAGNGYAREYNPFGAVAGTGLC